MDVADNTDGNRLRFTVNRERGHVVSWSLHDRATRLMLAHSRGRSMIDGRKVAFDPNVERTARIMGHFFGDGVVEEALLRLIDSDLLPEPGAVAAPRASASALVDALQRPEQVVPPEWLIDDGSEGDRDVEPGVTGPLESAIGEQVFDETDGGPGQP